MPRSIDNSEDVIDSRDVTARIEELEGERDAANEDAPAVDDDGLTAWDRDNSEDAAELKALKALADEAEGYAPDWTYGAALIRESYFVEYCQDLLEDIGDLPKDLPSYIEIDWEATARNLKVDYTEVDFDGVPYLVR